MVYHLSVLLKYFSYSGSFHRIFISVFQLPAGEYWDELKVVSVLENLRSKQHLNEGQSFESIVAFGTNTALPHYIPSNKTNKKIDRSGLLMIDSGGQYLGEC